MKTNSTLLDENTKALPKRKKMTVINMYISQFLLSKFSKSVEFWNIVKNQCVKKVFQSSQKLMYGGNISSIYSISTMISINTNNPISGK